MASGKKKSLSDRLAVIALQQKGASGTKRGANLATFLAVREEVYEALSDGWPIRSIWEGLRSEGRINCSYRTLCRLIKNDGALDKKKNPSREPKNHPNNGPKKEAKIDSPLKKGFAHNNTYDVDKLV